MSETVIKVENLSKRYRIGAKEGYKTFRETLIDSAKAPFLLCKEIGKRVVRPLPSSAAHGRESQENTIWALKDISFQVKQGEVVGIIGRNGAGKSTMLKVFSKITEPTSGRVRLRGRVGSLLEVGTGFHPELTGHENIYLYGAILGMDRWEISRKFDDIVAFAELEEFVDTPVKKYSSGMYVRLAFAVAAYLEPDIFLVDEVLAVGDARFWSKSIKRMRELNEQGMTILLVSHNMWLIQTFCSTSLFLEKGHMRARGDPLTVIESYRELDKNLQDSGEVPQLRSQSSEDVKLSLFQVFPEGDWATEKEAFPYSGVRTVLGAEVASFEKVKLLIRITSPDGFSFFTSYSDPIDTSRNSRIKYEAVVEHLMLLPGEYLLWGAVCSADDEQHILAAENVPLFVKGDGESARRYSLFWNEAYWQTST
jgi:lipopolysaccharide transport system ATP-binding protein